MTSHYTFDRTIELLNELYHRPIKPASEARLERIGHLLHQLGNPHRSFRSVHIAGSFGKGSTTSMIGSILQASDFRTGYFRSPHLHDYRERIAVDGEDIDAESWTRCFERVWPIAEEMQNNRTLENVHGRPALFEILFALMSVYFHQVGVEWAAVETGLGGRLDATNTLESDVAVVTNVSLEHTQILGSTVGEIAAEKAAIIKRGSHAVTAAEDPEALRVITERAQVVGAPLLTIGVDVHVDIRSEWIAGQKISLEGAGAKLDVTLPLAAPFQSTNAATAFGAALALRDRGVNVSDGAVVHGLSTVKVPGRFELISRDPLVILDGAHNVAAVRQLRTAIERLIPDRRRVLLFASMNDKDIRGMATEIGSLVDQAVITRPPGTDRAASPLDIASAFERWVPQIETEDNPDRALALALRTAGTDSAVIVTGSLYLVGHVRHALAAGQVTL